MERSMNKCPFNKTDSFNCHWKYLTAYHRFCTYLKGDQECCVECHFGKPKKRDLEERIKELEIALKYAKIEAAKEVAEEIKKRTSSFICAARVRWVVDDILKEMEGDV